MDSVFVCVCVGGVVQNAGMFYFGKNKCFNTYKIYHGSGALSKLVD